MFKAFGDFRKKKPADKQTQKPTNAKKTDRKPMPKKTTIVPAARPMAPKKITTTMPKDIQPPSPSTPAHKVEFHQDGIFIDGIKYKVMAENGISDEELTIGSSQEENGATTLRLITMGRTFTVLLEKKDIDAMTKHLLAGRPSKIDSEEGTVMRIERQMY